MAIGEQGHGVDRRSPHGWGVSAPSIRAAAAVFASIVLALVSCKDSHHHARTSFHSDPHHPPRGGVVIIWVHDAPSDRLAAFFASFDAVALVREDGSREEVFRAREPRRVELLSLRERDGVLFAELLGVARDVPAGRYGAIRVTLGEVSLVDGAGARIADRRVRVAGVRTIEVPLDEPVVVESGGAHGLVIDLDVDRSIHRIPGGNGGWIVRPAVAASATEGVAPPALGPVDLRGHVREVSGGGRMMVELEADGGWIEVDTRGAAMLAAPAMELAAPGETAPGDPIHVRGRVTDGPAVAASIVVVGDSALLRGTVQREPTLTWTGVTEIAIDALDDPDSASAGVVSVRVPAAAALSIDRLVGADALWIAPGQRVEVIITTTPDASRNHSSAFPPAAGIVDIRGDGPR